MTNGEKIKEIFPNAEYLECEVVMDVVFARNQENWFDLEWWNAEYKKSTTKNDLGVDCISRAEAIRVASGYCHPSNVAKELAKLPSMGRYDPYTDKFIKE